MVAKLNGVIVSHFVPTGKLVAYGGAGDDNIQVAGEVPNPLAPPAGCAFHPRCPYANERCRRERPQVIDHVACHAVQERRINLAIHAA